MELLEVSRQEPSISPPPRGPESPGTQVAAVAPALRSLRILVVDDNREAAASLALLLERMGHEVRTAHDGPGGVSAAKAFAPQVALLDLGLPGLDGLATAREIRAQPGGETIVFIAVTGWGRAEDRRRSQAAGFSHHLLKPLDPAQLARLLRAIADGLAPATT
jgi:CheY-like chemotaxis protein